MLTLLSLFSDAYTVVSPHLALLSDASANAGALVAAAGPIDEAVDKAVAQLRTLGRPIAILGVVLLALSWIASGWLPEWAQQNKGVLVKMFMGGVLLGIAPDVVTVFLPK